MRAQTAGNRSESAQGVTVGTLVSASDYTQVTSASLGTATMTAADDVVTFASAHGLRVGDVVIFGTLTGAGNLTAGNIYFVRTVISPTAIDLTTAPGGSKRDITSDGSTVAVYRRELAYYTSVNPLFRILGTRAVQGGSFPANTWIKSDPTIVSVGAGTITGPALTVSVDTVATTALDVLIRNNGGTSQSVIMVDGRTVATVTTAQLTTAGVAVGSVGRVRLVFDGDQRRNIQVLEETHGSMFAGFDVKGRLAFPVTTRKGPRVLLVGDSYTEGTGSGGTPYARWLSWHMGWDDLWRAGSGGTGYVKDGTRLALVDRYANDITAQAPNTCIIAMGLNDESEGAAATIAAAETVLDAVVAALPATEFIVVGPWSPTGFAYAPQVRKDIDAGLEAASAARGLRFVSPLQEDWITGNGREGATTGNGNSDIYISTDGTHPNVAGHEYLGWRLAGALSVPHLAA